MDMQNLPFCKRQVFFCTQKRRTRMGAALLLGGHYSFLMET